MVLKDEDAKLFYDLWIPLLDFVNRKYKLVRGLYGMTSPEGMPLKSAMKIADKLWKDKSVIDEYILSGSKQMNEAETAIVRSWKRTVYGRFIVERHLNKGSVLISLENGEVYIVKGLYSSWRELLENYPMPQIVQAMLMPFRDVIVHSGLISPYGVCLGKNMSDQSKKVYLAAKAGGKLRYNL